MRVRSLCKLWLSIITVAIALPLSATDHELIPFEKFVLDNGLTLIVHEDDKAPIVAVNIWYHVGSRNETTGKTGYAHLFEHLMFQGSEHSQGEYIEQLEKVGATGLNGTTWFDRTNYYQTVPVNALDRVLFLESDRMGHLLDAIDQAVLDEQRGVVQNEKRQGDNQPYSKLWPDLLRQVFPPDHPYSWETIGSMEDLEAASLEDMQTWFKTYYGPNNAVLVVAGDVDPQDVLKRVEKYFADIPAGPPLIVQEEWIPLHTAERRQIMEDRVPQARLYMAWTGPKWGTTEANHLEMARSILASGKNSRLYKRLVYEDQIATDAAMEGYAFEIAGLEILEASAKDGVTLNALEAAAREELERFVKDGPSKAELERVKSIARAAFIRGIETVGGPGSKSAVLAENMVYGGDPGLYQKRQNDFANATRDDLRQAVAKWIGRPPYVAHIEPYPEFSAVSAGVDRSQLPEPATPAAAVFPAIARATLENGMQLAVVNRPTVPDVKFNLIFNAGYAGDKLESAGQASLAMAMLDEGAGKLDALEISEQLDMLGAELGTGVGLDSANVSLSALTENLDASLELFAEVVRNPSFPADELERLRGQYLTLIQQEKVNPTSMALRLLPGMLYGEGHAYAQPLTGTGTETSVKALTRDDLITWHETWFRPNNATLVVVGDTTLEIIRPKLETLFADWESAPVPAKNVRMVEPASNDTIYLIDKPDAEQSIIMAGQLIAPLDNPNEVAIKAMNDMLGGQFSSRINLNLRESKNWSYGARTLIWETQAQRPLLAYAPVQTDKTAPALKEILREINDIRDSNPPSAAELERVQQSRTLSLPGRWETNTAVAGAVSEIVSYALPFDYWDGYAERINSLDLSQVTAAANSTLSPDQLIWVIIGDREKIAAELEATGIGTIRLIDADGNPVANSE